MLDTLRSVFSLFLSYGLLLLANGLFATLLGVRTRLGGFSTLTTGVIVAFFFLGLFSGALFGARVVARVGHIRAFAAFASVMSASALFHVLWINAAGWCVFRWVAGFCMAGMVMVTESWVNDRATNENRGQVMSIYMIVNYFAAGCGQFILPLGDPGSFELFIVASIVYSFCPGAGADDPGHRAHPRAAPARRFSPALADVSARPNRGAARRYGQRRVSRAWRRLRSGDRPDLGRDLHVYRKRHLRGPPSPVAGGTPVDRFDRRRVLVGVTIATTVVSVVMIQAAARGVWLYGLSALYGGFSFTIYSICAAHTNDFADRERLMETASGLLMSYGLGAVVGPIIAGTLMGPFGPSGMLIWSAGVNAALAGFPIARMFKRDTKVPEERAPIINLPGGQHTSGVLYDRLRDERDRDVELTAGETHEPESQAQRS